MKVGIYGGSFDPVHLAHLQVAEAVYSRMALDKLYFVPAAHSPFKTGQHSAPDPLRLQWLKKALEGTPHLQIDERELHRGGVSYTIETAREYAIQYPQADLFYIIGMDNAPQLPLWFRAQELASLVQFAVVTRPGCEHHLPGMPFRCHVIEQVHCDIASHCIRERIATGRSITGLVPTNIESSILESGAYK